MATRWRVRRRPSSAASFGASLQASDLTFLGQVYSNGLADSSQNMAVRYVGGERRFLGCELGGTILADLQATISGTTLTVTSLGVGSTLAVGQYLGAATDASGNYIPLTEPPYITAQLTGTPNDAGTYSLSVDQTSTNLIGTVTRVLTYSSSDDRERIGDLVEYKITAALMNGASHWVDANVPGWTEVRRWTNWATTQRMKASGNTPYPGSGYSAQWRSQGAAGVIPSGFYWDEAHGCLWYALAPEYPGAEIIWPSWNAVTLADGEAGGAVSDANIHGPYYFRDKTVTDDWKDGSSGLIAIDSTRQAAMGGTHLAVGHHMANIGEKGARSLGMWVVPSLPAPPARDSVLWSTAVHLLDTSYSSGKAAPNLHKPNISKNMCYHGGNSLMANHVKSGVVSYVYADDAIGLAVDDCIYIRESPYFYIDCVTVFMTSGASGGAWVPEVNTGTSGAPVWTEPTGWACSAGDTALSGVENVFYWPKVAFAPSTLAGVSFDYWVRLRRTSVGATSGSCLGVIGTISMNNVAADALPLPGDGYVGSYVRHGSGTPLYDATHYGYQFVEPMYGGAWVKTSNVEGLAYFGAIGGGGYAYCGVPCYAQPQAGGVPIKYECANVPFNDSSEATGFAWSNGPRWETPIQPHFLPFAPSDLVTAAGDSAKRFSDFLNPAAYTELYSNFSGLISQYTVTNPRISSEPYFGEPWAQNYYTGHSVYFDSVTNQLIVLIPTQYGTAKSIMAFFQVR